MNIRKTSGDNQSVLYEGAREIDSIFDSPDFHHAGLHTILTFNNKTIGNEPWFLASDNDPELLADINSENAASAPEGFTNFAGSLYFWADNGVLGKELWKKSLDSSPRLVSDLNNSSISSLCQLNEDNNFQQCVIPTFAQSDDNLYFSTVSGNSSQIWQLDPQGVLTQLGLPNEIKLTEKMYAHDKFLLFGAYSFQSSNFNFYSYQIDTEKLTLINNIDVFASPEFLDDSTFIRCEIEERGKELCLLDLKTGESTLAFELIDGSEDADFNILGSAFGSLYLYVYSSRHFTSGIYTFNVLENELKFQGELHDSPTQKTVVSDTIYFSNSGHIYAYKGNELVNVFSSSDSEHIIETAEWAGNLLVKVQKDNATQLIYVVNYDLNLNELTKYTPIETEYSINSFLSIENNLFAQASTGNMNNELLHYTNSPPTLTIEPINITVLEDSEQIEIWPVITALKDSDGDELRVKLGRGRGELKDISTANQYGYSFKPLENENRDHSFAIYGIDYFAGTSAVPINIFVTPVNDPPTGTLTLVGEPIEDRTLSVKNEVNDVDGISEYSYIWLADGKAIFPEHKNTLKLTDKLVGYEISVKMEYTDNDGTDESVVSNKLLISDKYGNTNKKSNSGGSFEFLIVILTSFVLLLKYVRNNRKRLIDEGLTYK